MGTTPITDQPTPSREVEQRERELVAPRGVLMVLPGWDDDGEQQFFDIQNRLKGARWHCHRADLPDRSWPPERRRDVSRQNAFRNLLAEYDALIEEFGKPPWMAVLGFSFGGYMATFLAAVRHVDALVLRSPAIYRDAQWDLPKEELDKGDLDDYRAQTLAPGQNGALGCCSRFEGDALLLASELDEVIPPTVIGNYERAFVRVRSLERRTLKGADHQLTLAAHQKVYHDLLVEWLLNRAEGNSAA